jgi:hypothetical protein
MDRPEPVQRVTPPRPPSGYELPVRPEGASPAVLDAYRQTSFLLGKDLRLFAEGMNLQLEIVSATRPTHEQRHAMAAMTGLWSRAYLYCADACALLTQGGYASCLPLVRAACECLAAEAQLHASEMDEFRMWLAGTLRPDETHKAMEFEMGRYFAGEALASDPALRVIYRAASDLGRPNFGATLLQVGPESNNLKIALTFADRAFHVAWAELIMGWLLALSAYQLRVACDATDVFQVSDDIQRHATAFRQQVDALLSSPLRCRIEEIEEGSYKRYLVHNFRRATSAAPKKILL